MDTFATACSVPELAALAENQAATLNAAIEAMTDGVFIGDAQGVQRCNQAALGLLGATSAADFRGEPAQLVRRYRLRRDRDGPLLSVAELPFWNALKGQSQVLELWASHVVSGADLFMRCAAAPIMAEGQVLGAVAVLGDLTERLQLHQKGHDLRRVQNVLHERNAELRAMLRGVRDYAIYTLDTEGRIASWHPGAQRMKGYGADEAVGMPFARLFTRDDQAQGLPAEEMAVAARTGEYKGEGWRVRKDGSIFEVAVVLTALRGAGGELLGFLKLTQDITQRRLLEREHEEMLRQAQCARAEAERSSHSKGEFLATISHELRTPLSAILGWAHVLERGVFDPDTVKHGLGAISRNARIQVQLIEDLLDMNRIESGQLRLELQRIELGGVIAAAIDSALPAASAKGIGLRTAFGPVGGLVMGDAARLQQVVGNLLNNAIKFTPPGGQISVTLDEADGQAHIAVADTGQGIEPDFLARIFERFQQQDAGITRRHGGMGIGLAIVRHLVQLHGGNVRVHSPGPGQGSTFTVSLPTLASAGLTAPLDRAPEQQAVTPACAEPTEPATRLDNVSVLLVDDEPDVRAVTTRLLQDAGAHVMAAASADEALDLLRRQKPAVILSDVGMPDVDGYELIRRVRELPPTEGGQTPAAAFTAFTRPVDQARALAAGYQMHLAKPVPPLMLLTAVATLMRRRLDVEAATGP
jgi:PAS domain S-box-containing protein